MMMFSMYDGDRPSERFGADDYTYLEDGTSDLSTGLASLGFIRGVLGRTRRVWCICALAGLVIGMAAAVLSQPSYQATTSLLLTPETSQGEVASTCCPASGPIYNEQTIAGSRPVAELALQKLGLNQSVNDFLKTYTVAALTDRVLQITAKASTAAAAVTHATVIGNAFLQFRANLAETAQNLVSSAAQQQISQAKQNVKSISDQISRVSAEPPSSAQEAQLKTLKTELDQANLNLGSLQSTNASNTATSQANTNTVIQDSRVLNAATLTPPHSGLKRTAEYAALGFFALLVVSMAVIIVTAFMSDKLRRRDDVAQALGAPVEASTGQVGLGRWRPSRRGLAAAQGPGVKRLVAYLDRAVPSASQRPASLAVVPVDDVRVPAICLTALALSCAQRGQQVVVADLCPGAPAARLLGAGKPGVQTVTAQGSTMIVVVPERGDAVPDGPLQRASGQDQPAQALVDACASADVLLTLAPLDPTLGAEYLGGWTRGVVAMITTGRSTAARIHAVGEMVRMAGLKLMAGVLVGADSNDESLGVPARPIAGDEGSLNADMADDFALADKILDGRQPGDGRSRYQR
jgi:capsular polysaccharide biosynthesis protein